MNRTSVLVGRATASTALLTDHYELTMLEAALRSGAAGRRAAFEVFARRLPDGRRYGVVGGIGRLLEELAAFHFGEDELVWLENRGFLSPSTINWLADYRFSGSIRGYREGELFFPYSPVLTIEATFAEAVLLETLVLSVLNHDSAVAAAAARMVSVADGRLLIEAGGRRTHERAAPAASRAAYVAGFAATSNLEAGRRWGIPTGGTTGHSFMLVYDDERAAFQSQVDTYGPDSTFLVDTFDIAQGIRLAVDVAGPGLGAIRIDSGDLAVEARRARALLDELGATRTEIVVSGDLNEYRIAELSDAPVDRMLAGTELVTGSEAPTAGMVFKLVAVDSGSGWRAVAKTSQAKASRGGVKETFRLLDASGIAVGEALANGSGDETQTGSQVVSRPLQQQLVAHGEITAETDPDSARAHHQAAMAELSDDDRSIEPGVTAFEVK